MLNPHDPLESFVDRFNDPPATRITWEGGDWLVHAYFGVVSGRRIILRTELDEQSWWAMVDHTGAGFDPRGSDRDAGLRLLSVHVEEELATRMDDLDDSANVALVFGENGVRLVIDPT